MCNPPLKQNGAARWGVVALLIAGAMLAGCSSVRGLRSGEAGNVKPVSSEDAGMNRAIEQAQKTLPAFIEALQSPKSTQTHFAIKAIFPYGENNGEHMWVSGLSFAGDQFEGTLDNQPVYAKDVHLGDHVTVGRKDVSDWMIVQDNTLLGGFTIHELRNRMTAGDRAQFDAQMQFNIPEQPALP